MRKFKKLIIACIAAALIVTSLPLGALNITASAAEDYPEVVLDAVNHGNIATANERKVYKFTPTVNDMYIF